MTKAETKEQEVNRLWNESLGRIYTPISIAVNNPLLQAGLQQVGGPRQIHGWSSEEYGGAAQTPTWGISTIANPWLAGAFGAVHRSQPVLDIEDVAVVFVLAKMTPDSQQTYMREFLPFRLRSQLSLDRVLEQLTQRIAVALPSIVADFLTAYKTEAIPRQ